MSDPNDLTEGGDANDPLEIHETTGRIAPVDVPEEIEERLAKERDENDGEYEPLEESR